MTIIQDNQEPTFSLELSVSPTYEDTMGVYVKSVEDMSIETVVSTLSELIAVMNSSQWVIGDLLNFIRHRGMYHETVYDNLSDLMIDKSVSDNQLGSPDEFLYWRRFQLDNGDVVLSGKSDARYWRFISINERTDVDFLSYVNGISLLMIEQLGPTNLWNYFRVAQAFPPSTRGSNSWTWYLTEMQRAALEVGTPDREIVNERARQIAATDAGNGFTTVTHARHKLAETRETKAGWRMLMSPPPGIVIDDGYRRYTIVEFTDEFHATNICRWLGLANGLYEKVVYRWEVGKLLVGKSVVAKVFMDTTDAENAVYEIAKKMKWQTVK